KDVHREARAVEAARRWTSPDVGDSEVLHRDSHHPAVVAGRVAARVVRDPRLGLVRQSLLLGPFGGLDLRDLLFEAREKLRAPRELAADLVALARTFRDEPLL